MLIKKRKALFMQAFAVLLFIALLLPFQGEAGEDFSEQCIVEAPSSPIAQWNFSKDREFPLENGLVKFKGRRGGIEHIPNTSFYGIKFHYKKGPPHADAMAELRYDILEPQSHIFEHLKIYQPTNFYHRLIVQMTPTETVNLSDWKTDDLIVTDKGDSGKVAQAVHDKIFIKDPTGIHKKSWGEGTLIKNTSNNATIESKTSKFLGSNNKLSAMWQGKYSNAAMIMETRARSIEDKGAHGNGYCSPKGSRSSAHGPFGEQRNYATVYGPAACFDVVDNGSIIELVIERKRASNLDEPDGIYRIWKRTTTKPWELIFENLKVPAYQPEKNYFDSGYILGWANSGYKEDTDFFITGWALWNKKPPFLPN